MTAVGRVRVERADDIVVARIEGELDLSNTGEIRSAIVSSVGNEVWGVVVDLSATAYLDSSGLSLLFDLARRLSNRQQALGVVVPPESPLRRLLEFARLSDAATIEQSVEDAVAAMRPDADNGH